MQKRIGSWQRKTNMVQTLWRKSILLDVLSSTCGGLWRLRFPWNLYPKNARANTDYLKVFYQVLHVCFQAALNNYTFENVAFHLLHQRFPLYSHRTLSDWFDHNTHLHRWELFSHLSDAYYWSCCMVVPMNIIASFIFQIVKFRIECYHTDYCILCYIYRCWSYN